jgi:hypothetical protein
MWAFPFYSERLRDNCSFFGAYLCGDEHPDHATIVEFRRRHLESLSGLFKRALAMCSEAGLMELGHAAIEDRGQRQQGHRD